MSAAARRPGLDVMRVVAVAAVAWFHYGFRMQVTGEAGPAAGSGDPGDWARFGYLGVSVFFAISGYVISISTEGRDPFTFAVARVARLWPVYVAAMTLTVLVTLAVPALGFPLSLPQYLANLTMLSPLLGQPFMDGAYWSIVAEILFYGWVGLLMLAGLWSRHQVLVALAWLAVATLDQAVIGSDVLRRLLLTDFAGFFAFGMMLRACERGEAGARLVLLAAFVQAIAAAVLFAGGLVEVYRGEPFPPLAVGGIVAVSLVVLALATRLQAPWLPAGPVTVAGRATYPFYLLHQHIGYAGFFLLVPVIGLAGSAAVILAGVALVSLLLTVGVERPAARLVRGAGERVRMRALSFRRRPVG